MHIAEKARNEAAPNLFLVSRDCVEPITRALADGRLPGRLERVELFHPAGAAREALATR